MPTAALRKVLLIRLSSIGDIILSTPMLRAFKTAYPDAELHFLTREEFGDLLRHSPWIDRLITIETAGGRGELRALNLRLMAERYDAVFDLHNNFRSRVLRNGLSNRVHVIHKRSFRRLLLTRLHINTMRNVPPVPERYIETARRYGLRPDGAPPVLHPSDTARENARRILVERDVDPDSPGIGLCVGAKHFTKRWPVERFEELAEQLHVRGAHLLLLGGAEDRNTAAAILRRVPDRIVDLTGALSLMETAAAMTSCAVVVANDSGLMHMATAVGTPVVALFGSTVREFGFFPSHAPAEVIEISGLSCRPCTHIGRAACPRGHFSCLRDIPATRVLDAIDRLRARADGSS